jgi:hypothetical protein
LQYSLISQLTLTSDHALHNRKKNTEKSFF